MVHCWFATVLKHLNMNIGRSLFLSFKPWSRQWFALSRGESFMKQPHTQSPQRSEWPQALSQTHTHTHDSLACWMASAPFLQRRIYCVAPTDLNETDMKGLTEIKPGSRMLMHAHSYSYSWAAAHWRTRAHIRTSRCMQAHSHSQTVKEWRIQWAARCFKEDVRRMPQQASWQDE